MEPPPAADIEGEHTMTHHDLHATDRLHAAARRVRPILRRRGMAILLAIVAVALAVIIGLAVASNRNATTTTSGTIARAAEARAASRGALEIADFIVRQHSEIIAGDPNEALREVFAPKTIGRSTLSATIEDPNTGASPTRTSVGIEFEATAQIDGASQTLRAKARAPWADTIARADLDLSEFGMLATSGGITVGDGSEVSMWRDAPLSDLGEPIVVGTRTRQPNLVAVHANAIALGVAKISPGNFPADRAAADELLADGLSPLPADIQVPAAPRQGISENYETVDAADLDDAINEVVGTTVPRIKVSGATTLDTEMTVQGPVAPGTWRVLAFDGALILDAADWTFEVPTMIVATGGVTLRNSAKLQVGSGGALTIVSNAGVTVTDSYIGAKLPPGGTRPDADGGAPYGGVGASAVTIFAQPSPEAVLVNEGSVVTGEIYAPDAAVTISDASAVYGRVLGGSVVLDDGRLFYDPALDTGRGWLNPESAVYEAENDVRDAVAGVTVLNDESLAAFTLATSVAVESPGNQLIVTAHVDAAGGYDAGTTTNSVDGGVAADGSMLPGATGLSGATGSTTTYPESFEVHGTLRDFRESTHSAGHPDFDNPAYPNGLRWGLVKPTLSADGKPELLSGTAKSMKTLYKDSAGNAIAPALYNPSLGDVAGTLNSSSQRSITSAATFANWFRDSPGVNLSEPFTLLLRRTIDSSGRTTYVFDSLQAEPFVTDDDGPMLDGFFPLEGRLYGNSGPRTRSGVTHDRNFAFTLELETQFTYRTGASQAFTFRGDDDVWVFINGGLVIDIGGIHGPQPQVVHLDRLGLVDGQTYPLKLFFAERRPTGCNFRMASNFPLASPLPAAAPSDPLASLEAIVARNNAVLADLLAGRYATPNEIRAIGRGERVMLRAGQPENP